MGRFRKIFVAFSEYMNFNKLKNGLCRIVTKSQFVTKFNVTKSRLHCTLLHFQKLDMMVKAQIFFIVSSYFQFFFGKGFKEFFND